MVLSGRGGLSAWLAVPAAPPSFGRRMRGAAGVAVAVPPALYGCCLARRCVVGRCRGSFARRWAFGGVFRVFRFFRFSVWCLFRCFCSFWASFVWCCFGGCFVGGACSCPSPFFCPSWGLSVCSFPSSFSCVSVGSFGCLGCVPSVALFSFVCPSCSCGCGGCFGVSVLFRVVAFWVLPRVSWWPPFPVVPAFCVAGALCVPSGCSLPSWLWFSGCVCWSCSVVGCVVLVVVCRCWWCFPVGWCRSFVVAGFVVFPFVWRLAVVRGLWLVVVLWSRLAACWWWWFACPSSWGAAAFLRSSSFPCCPCLCVGLCLVGWFPCFPFFVGCSPSCLCPCFGGGAFCGLSRLVVGGRFPCWPCVRCPLSLSGRSLCCCPGCLSFLSVAGLGFGLWACVCLACPCSFVLCLCVGLSVVSVFVFLPVGCGGRALSFVSVAFLVFVAFALLRVVGFGACSWFGPGCLRCWWCSFPCPCSVLPRGGVALSRFPFLCPVSRWFSFLVCGCLAFSRSSVWRCRSSLRCRAVWRCVAWWSGGCLSCFVGLLVSVVRSVSWCFLSSCVAACVVRVSFPSLPCVVSALWVLSCGGFPPFFTHTLIPMQTRENLITPEKVSATS